MSKQLGQVQAAVEDFAEYAELVLGLHGDLDHRQRVDVQVVDERLLGGHFGRLDAGDLFDDLRETGDDFFLTGGHSVAPFIYRLVLRG